jgi:RNA polymerase sigma-70 factor (ECF subfamily)
MDRFGLKLIPLSDALEAPAELAGDWLGPPSHAFIHRLESGDPESMTLLYRTHQQPLRALARRLLGDEIEAEDLVHDVFVALPKALRNYSGETPLSTFLCGMLVNFSRRRLRSFGRFRRALARLVDRGAPVSTPHAGPAALEQRELALRLSAALDGLSFAQRAVVVLCLVEERSAQEASEILGVPEATVRTRLFYGRKKLQALLGEPKGVGE